MIYRIATRHPDGSIVTGEVRYDYDTQAWVEREDTMSTTIRIDITATRAVIDAISRDSRISDDPAVVGAVLKTLYAGWAPALELAISEQLADPNWSEDRQPYEWLREVAAYT